MIRFFPIFFLLTGLFFTPATSNAFEAVVAMNQYPPWKIIDGNYVGGIDAQLITALLKEAGGTPHFVLRPWARGLHALKTGEADMLTGVLKRPERKEFMYFIEPPYKTRSSKAFYVRKGSRDIQSYEDLHNKIIGMQRGSKYFPRFDEDKQLSKHEVHSDSLNFQKLVQGRIDAVIATESQGDYQIALMKLNDELKKCTYRHDKVMPVYFTLSKESQLSSMYSAFNKAAKRLSDNGTFDRIIKTYFEKFTAKGLPLAN